MQPLKLDADFPQENVVRHPGTIVPQSYVQLADFHFTFRADRVSRVSVPVPFLVVLELKHFLELRTGRLFAHFSPFANLFTVRVNDGDDGVRIARAVLQGQVEAFDDADGELSIGRRVAGPGGIPAVGRLEFDLDVRLALDFGVGVDRPDGEPVVLVVVLGELFPFDRYFPYHFVLFHVAVAVVEVDGEVAELAGDFELEFFAEKGTEGKKVSVIY